jgi:hypothetical protein
MSKSKVIPINDWTCTLVDNVLLIKSNDFAPICQSYPSNIINITKNNESDFQINVVLDNEVMRRLNRGNVYAIKMAPRQLSLLEFFPQQDDINFYTFMTGAPTNIAVEVLKKFYAEYYYAPMIPVQKRIMFISEPYKPMPIPKGSIQRLLGN